MKQRYTSIEQLPVSLSAPEVAQFLGISRAGAYNLLLSRDVGQAEKRRYC
ncbi:MAG: hypothetical protein FWH04_08490 [Oscillospiraceae bacterium]|nr:hypothetical protein [Oscillospiraceae bacterium]